MISILLGVLSVAYMTISGMSLYFSGIYTGNGEHKNSIIAGIVSLVTFITSVCIASLIR